MTYIVSCPRTSAAAIIDPVLDYDPAAGRTSNTHNDAVLAHVEQHTLRVQWIWETHVHADHLTGAARLAEATGAQTAIGEHVAEVQATFKALFNLGDDFAADGSQFDRLLKDGDQLTLGELPVRVYHTPGHTPACVCYLVGNSLFTGDTLFMPDAGTARCDFPGGSAEALYRSIRRLYASVPEDARVFVGHDYAPGGREVLWESSIKAQKEANKQLSGATSEEQFVGWRADRDKTLGAPRLLIPSLQVNLRNGRLPPAEANGTVYLKVPVNVI
jgi:glyoxylase-like metal-dependent hydrolase (beta-lactamase superfamily II)